MNRRSSKPKRSKRTADAGGRSFAGTAAGGLRRAGVHDRLQKRAGGENHGRRAIDGIAANAHADNPRPLADGFGEQFLDHFLPQHHIRLLFDDPLHFELIKLLVGLARGLCIAGPLRRLSRRN